MTVVKHTPSNKYMLNKYLLDINIMKMYMLHGTHIFKILIICQITHFVMVNYLEFPRVMIKMHCEIAMWLLDA